MRKLAAIMNIAMGACMSFVLSLVGTLTSGHFSVPSWLVSLAISFVISLIIGFLVPVGRLGGGLCRKCGVPERSFKGTLLSAALSNLIYTPVITVIMVTVMMKIAASHAPEGSMPPVAKALVPALGISLVVGYIVIVIIQPILMKAIFGRAGEDKE